MARVMSYGIAILCAAPFVVHAATQRAAYAPPPAYPAEAKTQHLTGSGVFALHIRPNGTVERVETVTSIGHPLLDRAAITAFRQWRFHSDDASWVLRIPIRYIDGPKRVDSAMLQSPTPGWGVPITVFSGGKR